MFNKKKVMVNYEKGDRVIRERFNPETNEYVREEVVLPGQKSEAFVGSIMSDIAYGIKGALPVIATIAVGKIVLSCINNHNAAPMPDVNTVNVEDDVKVETI